MSKYVAGLSLLAGPLFSKPAYAQYYHSYRYDPASDGSFVAAVFIALVLGGLYYLYEQTTRQSSSSSDCDCAESDAERYEEEARRLRALKQRTDAETELTASLIDKARIDAAYRELNQITHHDREVRRLSRRS
jgi:hypothetical protein